MRKVLLASCLGSVAAFVGAGASANDQLIKMSQNPKDWVMPSGDYANTRYSKLNQITAANVGKLQVAWTFSTGVLRGHEGAPLIIGNMMYVHTPFPNKVYALDLSQEQKIIWMYEPKQNPDVIPVMCCDTVNRGLAYSDGKIFLHQSDDKLIALDAKTGNLVWSATNGDPAKGQTGTSATSRRMNTTASSTSRYCPASVAGPVSAWRRGCWPLTMRQHGSAPPVAQRRVVHWTPPRETWRPPVSVLSAAMRG